MAMRMTAKGRRLDEREGYAEIGKAYGLTTNGVKELFRSMGWLEGNEPTDRALADGTVTRKALENSRYGNGPATMLLWRMTDVDAAMRKAGRSQDLSKRVWSGHSAADRIGEAGDTLMAALGKDAPAEATMAAAWMHHEGTWIVGMVTARRWADASRTITDARREIEGALGPIRKDALVEEAFGKIGAVMAGPDRPGR